MFVSHLQNQDCVRTPEFFGEYPLNGQLEDHEERLVEFDQMCPGFELRTAPLRAPAEVHSGRC